MLHICFSELTHPSLVPPTAELWIINAMGCKRANEAALITLRFPKCFPVIFPPHTAFFFLGRRSTNAISSMCDTLAGATATCGQVVGQAWHYAYGVALGDATNLWDAA